jgi:hypothetical protein
MPVDTFFDAMGMFAASLGNDSTFCHVMTITLREVSVNVPVDASRFARPTEFRAVSR